MKHFILSIKLALRNLHNNKGRTILTLVGVVIGIMAVIVVNSSGEGVKKFVMSEFDSYGNDLVQIEPKVSSTSHVSSDNAMGQAMGIQITTLKISDSEALRKIPNVKDCATGTISQEVLSYQDENKKGLIFGVSANYPTIDSAAKVSEGTFFTDSEDEGLGQVVVIGTDIRDALFGNDNPIGKNVRIKGMNFKVIGVAEERGTVTFINYDEIVYMPVKTLQKKILGVDYIKFISAKIGDVGKINETAAEITDVMRRLHKADKPEKEDFSVITMQEAKKMVDDIFGTITILLLALTSISLVVGGVGIMNIMYVAVVERIFEIGLRKAVGAKSKDILRQFLFEAIILTSLGGIVGIILGFLMNLIFSYILNLMGFALQFSLTWNSVLLGVGFSMATGIIFGYYPAWKASKLSPMEALRKE